MRKASPTYAPLLRYPGGKYKLLTPILAELLRLIHTKQCCGYREPFFGGGAVGTNLMAQLDGGSVWINDRDLALGAIWDCVIKAPEYLKAAIRDFTPSVESFRQFRLDLPHGLRMKPHHFCSEEALSYHALMKLAVHQMSYSGLGMMAGGPLGGKDQASPYKIDSRWSPIRLARRIDELHQLFSSFHIEHGMCTNFDYELVLYGSKPALIYLDPPYYHKGSVCYEKGFSPADHQRLADMLRSSIHHWVLSYDDCPEIRGLYRWARIRPVPVTYSIHHHSHKHTELLITQE